MMIASAYVDLPLYLDGQPMWLEHSTRSAVDVVAIPLKLDQFDGFANTRINMVEQENRLEPRAGMDCFVLGVPRA